MICTLQTKPHGSQFTIYTDVPKEAIRFHVKQPPTLQKSDVLKGIDFDDSWITIVE